MKTVACYICGSNAFRVLDNQNFHDEYLALIDMTYLAQPRQWKVCQDCGFVYHDPRLDESDHATLYREGYRRLRGSSQLTPVEYFDKIAAIPRAESENWKKVEWLALHLKSLARANGKTLLDIGCSVGVFLSFFRQHFPGWHVAGVEPTVEFSEHASERLGIPVRGENYRAGLFDNPFDVITIIHVLEHVIDPIAFLSDVRKDIKDDGLLYLEVPDLQDFRHLPPDHDRFKAPHLYYFSDTVLSYICARAGFAVERMDRFRACEKFTLQLLCRASHAENLPLWREDPEKVLVMRQIYWTELKQ